MRLCDHCDEREATCAAYDDIYAELLPPGAAFWLCEQCLEREVDLRIERASEDT